MHIETLKVFCDIIESGMKVRIISTGDYFQSMAQVIIASDKMIQERPDLIRKLVRATLKGWQDIVNDPKAASIDYVKAVPQYAGKEAAMQRVFELYNKYVYINQPKPGVIPSDDNLHFTAAARSAGSTVQVRPSTRPPCCTMTC